MSKVFKLIKKEKKRQKHNIELIASENFVSKNVRKATASILCNKYAEGYPKNRFNNTGRAGRYYGGCECVDEIENYCKKQWLNVFGASRYYHVNVQPHSGSQANMAAYAAVLKPGDTILSMSLDAGGHLTHSASVSFVSKLYNVVTYGVDKNGVLNYDELEAKIYMYKPKLIVIGASAYPLEIDFEEIRDLIASAVDEINAVEQVYTFPYLMVDMAHIAGLVAAGVHNSPFGFADIITTTTQKTLRGPRGGLIFCKNYLANKVDFAVFPHTQGGPLEHIIAAKAVAAEECQTPEYRKYIVQVVKNCKAMAKEFRTLGYNLVAGGTENHLLLLNLVGTGITGLDLQELCDENGITLNKNAIPQDPLPPSLASGVRIGTAAMTTKGWKEKDFIKCARRIDKLIKEWSAENEQK